jgi:hypothetical protein
MRVPMIPRKQIKHLRCFPLLMDTKRANSFIAYMRSFGYMLRLELNECVWTSRQKLVYLPLGIQMNTDVQQELIYHIKNYLQLSQ